MNCWEYLISQFYPSSSLYSSPHLRLKACKLFPPGSLTSCLPAKFYQWETLAGNWELGRGKKFFFFFHLGFWQVVLVVEDTGQCELWVLTGCGSNGSGGGVFEQALAPGARTATVAIGSSQQPRALTCWVLGNTISLFTSLVLSTIVILCSYWSLGEFISIGSCSSSISL